MVAKKSDKEVKGDGKSKPSVFGLVKSMTDKLDPDLGIVEENNSKTNNSIDETESKKESKIEKKAESKSLTEVNDDSDIKKESKSHDNDSDISLTDKLKLQFHKLSNFIKEDRERLIKILGIIVGGFFIIAGIILVLGSADKVSDNVVFGERAVTSAFLVIIGILIIAGVFAQSIMKRTSFDNIYNEVKVAEENSSSKSDKDSSPKKENKEKVNVQNSDSSKK